MADGDWTVSALLTADTDTRAWQALPGVELGPTLATEGVALMVRGRGKLVVRVSAAGFSAADAEARAIEKLAVVPTLRDLAISRAVARRS